MEGEVKMEALLNISLGVTAGGAFLSLVGGGLSILYQYWKDRGRTRGPQIVAQSQSQVSHPQLPTKARR